MKRNDLTVGQDYLACPSQDWASTRGGYGRRRVRVLETGWETGRVGMYGTASTQVTLPDGTQEAVVGRKARTGGGTHVLVEVIPDPSDRYPGRMRADVIPTSQVRLPWAEWETMQAKREAAEREAQERRLAAEREQQEALERVTERLAQFGVHTQVQAARSSWVIPAAALDALLDAAEDLRLQAL